MHHDELAFDFGGMARFDGLEDADRLVIQTDDLKRGYIEAVENHNEQLEEMAERNRCERILIDTSLSMSEQLIDYLNKRSLLSRSR
jgi:hypothetical protein